MSHLRLIHSAPRPQPEQDWRFTSRDLLTLAEWMHRAPIRGYHHHVVESGSDAGTSADGAYILLYARDRAWANWGLARNADQITVWHCGSGVDLGRFPTMLDALESLPPVRPTLTRKVAASTTPAPRSNVVRLDQARRVQPGAR